MLPARLFRYLTSTGVVRSLKFLLGLSIAGKLNSRLSRYQLNNGKGAANFVKSQELVLISGGSSGIGKLMAEDFAKFGVKVVVVDLNPPKEAFREFLLALLWTLLIFE
jgi:all-trans-retinol dehydrogenase (NAD+)